MNITFGVPEEVLPNVKTGSKVDVEKNSDVIEGTVTEVSDKISASSGLYECKASLSNPKDLLSGSKTKVKFVSREAKGALTVPISAVSYANGKPFVYLYDTENMTAKKTEFESGLSDDTSMEVKSGIDAGSQVITTWSKEIYDGAPVLLKEQ